MNDSVAQHRKNDMKGTFGDGSRLTQHTRATAVLGPLLTMRICAGEKVRFQATLGAVS